MACVYRVQVFSGKLGYHFGLFHHSSISKHHTNIRRICLTSCHSKIPTGNRNSENDPKDDLDFFGIKESNKESKKFQKIPKSEKSYIHDLVEKYAIPSGPKNIQLKSYGSIRYDHKIPNSDTEVQQLEQSRQGTNLKQTRKQRRLNLKNKSDASKSSFILLSENVDSVEKDNAQDKENGRLHSSCMLYENTYKGENNLPFSNSKGLAHSDKNLSFIDEQYFSYDSSIKRNVELETQLQKGSQNEREEEDLSKSTKDDLPFIDEQYFSYDDLDVNKRFKFQKDKRVENLSEKSAGRKDLNELKLPKESKTSDKMERAEKCREIDKQDLSYFDEQYFSYSFTQDKMQHENKKHQHPEHLSEYRKERKHQKEEMAPSHSMRNKRNFDSKETSASGASDGMLKQGKGNPKDKLPVVLNNFEKVVGETPLTEKVQSAYEASMKVRAELEKKRGSNLVGKFDPRKYDSKGFRILEDQVPHFENAPSIDVVKVLRKSIIYDKNDIVAISKPYGLPSHDGPGVFHSVGNLLDQLIPRTQLFPVHRLDKEATGVMLFAKTEEMAKRLSERFLSRDMIKKYLVITKNVPEMQSGEIDIPITEGTVEGKVRMCLRPYSSPELSAVMKKRQPGTEAITRYKVLYQGRKCALLECFPVTGKKHQIRVHLAFGLNCPILGDHKYSHIDRIAPMKLHPEILDRLKIQQSKVRHLAMHLHARSIMIPEFMNGRNLFISAPLPPHFLRNMKDLKLKLPPHS